MIRKPIQDFFLFLVGGALFAAGIFLFTNQVMVNSGFRGPLCQESWRLSISTTFSTRGLDGAEQCAATARPSKLM